MRDANESYLTEHMAAVDESEHAADWKEDYVQALMAEGGELYPFKPDHFIEALRESGDGLLTASAAFFGTAEKLKSDISIQCAYLSIRLAVKDYWEAVANRKADEDKKFVSSHEKDYNQGVENDRKSKIIF